MSGDRGIRISLGLCVAFLAVAALYFAQSILAPIAFALFVIAIVWPVQRKLQRVLPALLALVITMLLTMCAIVLLGSMIVWGFGRAGQWLVSNGGRFQILYAQMVERLDEHGFAVAGLWAEYFDVRWLLVLFQQVSGRIQSLFSFGVVTLIFVILGLLEVDATQDKLAAMGEGGRAFLAACRATAAKLQRYMLIRTVMSLMTGVVIWGFISFAGLDLAVEWGVIAFAMNYIPFLGPLVATVFPTVFAVVQFEGWRAAAAVFVVLNLIQFLSGSYFEPRIAGRALAISPFIVLLAVLFWSFLWGLPGAFIGIPVTIAAITVCDQYAGSRWAARLLAAGA